MNKQQSPELSMVATADPEHVEEVRGTIATYLKAVKANDIATLRGLFDAKANVAHYHVKKDTVVTNTLDDFMAVIQSLHAKFDNAEEIGEAMNVRLVKYLASVELDFCFVMGPEPVARHRLVQPRPRKREVGNHSQELLALIRWETPANRLSAMRGKGTSPRSR